MLTDKLILNAINTAYYTNWKEILDPV